MKTYESPILEILRFSTYDIITDSNDIDVDGGVDVQTSVTQQ